MAPLVAGRLHAPRRGALSAGVHTGVGPSWEPGLVAWWARFWIGEKRRRDAYVQALSLLGVESDPVP